MCGWTQQIIGAARFDLFAAGGDGCGGLFIHCGGLACWTCSIGEQPALMGQFAGMTADGGERSERQNKFGTLAMKARADCYTFCYTARLLPRFLRYGRLWLEARRPIK